MLKVANGISDEEGGGAIYEKPDEGRIGGGKVRDHGGFVKLEDGLGGFFLLPEGVGEF